MAGALWTLAYPANSGISRDLCRPSSHYSSLLFRSGPLRATPRLTRRCFGNRALTSGRRLSRFVALAAPDEDSKHTDIEVERTKNELETKARESEEAWKQTLESFKEEATKLKDSSIETYALYSKKAMVILKEASETLKIQADQARHELAKLARDLGEDGRGYLASYPDCVKDVLEIYSSTDDLKDISQVRDFYVGILYGAFLAAGGFLTFMLTESISAIRFGLILGIALLYLSYSSYRSWKTGQPSEVYLKGQTAIVAIIFIREWRLFFQRQSFSTFLMTLISGAVLAFYIYRIIHDHGKGSSSAQDLKN